MAFQLADLFECLVDAAPDAEALATRERSWTRADLDARANRLAHHLAASGIGPGDHVGVLSHNRVEWIEALLACWKIRAVAINVNYRYVTDELRYLWRNAELVGLVYERAFAERVLRLGPEFPDLRCYLVLEDGSASEVEVPGERYEEALAAASDQRGFGPRSGDDRYVIYTGGTTGMPKGVVWRHEDLYSNIARPFAGGIDRPEQIARQSGNPLGMRSLTLSPLMHGGGQWPLFISLFNGGVGVLPTSHHFDPEEVMALIAERRVTTLSIIGDAMGRPLAEWALAHPDRYDTRSLVAISTGGALLTDPVRRRLREAFGRIYLTGGIGSSEIGSAAKETRAFDATTGPRFALDPDVAVLGDDLQPIEPGSEAIGRLARTGHIPLGYYNDPQKTAATFVLDASGRRWVLPGDHARVETDGTITLLGRGSECINTGGEKVFPDEVEAALCQHPAVRHAVVMGAPDPTWMERIVALVELEAGAPEPTLEALQGHCRRLLAGYKIPRALVFGEIERTPTGKVDYLRARTRALRAVSD
jgi:fatty-acyl-CoA synthase